MTSASAHAAERQKLDGMDGGRDHPRKDGINTMKTNKTVHLSTKHEDREAIVIDRLPETGDHVSFIYDDEVVTGTRWLPSGSSEYDFYEVDLEDANNPEDIECICIAVPKTKDMSIKLHVAGSNIDWLRQKFDINSEADLIDAIWECIDTYMQM